MPALARQLILVPLLSLTLLAAASAVAPVGEAAAASASSAAATPQPTPTTAAAKRQQKVLRAASIALKQIGDPYRYGATGPNAFDCSGLMKYAFGRAGIKLPRTSSAQARRAHRIPKSKLRRGDLMFFTDGGGVYHAAMFLRWHQGKAQMVHSPSSGKRVTRATPWTSSWFAGTVRR